MQQKNEPLQTLEDIRTIMDRSSRFISLSGLSGVAAGACALVASYVVWQQLPCVRSGACLLDVPYVSDFESLRYTLIVVALLTFAVAAALAIFFTYLRSRRQGVAMWGSVARRVLVNVLLPMVAGGFFILRFMQAGLFGFVAPACLTFYGLALVLASKYTVSEIRYLGYFQLLLGLLNLWFVGYGLYFWAFGFGVLHILYGLLLWNKYERNQEPRA